MSDDAKQFSAAYFADNYRNYVRQNPPAKMDFYRTLIERHAPAGESRRLLDIGCAFGRFLSYLPNDWHRVGLDLSEYAIRNARSAAGTTPAVNFAVASASDIPLRGTFDAIVAFDVIEHVPNLGGVAESVKRLLSPDGVFGFVVPVYDGPLGGVVRRLDRDPTHIHKRPRNFWLDWANEHFRVIDWLGTFRYLMPGGVYVHWPTRRLRGISPAIAVIVRSAPGKL